MRIHSLPLLALAAALGLAACNKAAPTANSADMALANDGDVMTNDELAAADADAAPPAIPVPTVAADASAADSVPIAEAAETAATIASDSGITQIAQDDGWAWVQDGQIIRTASRDGSRVSYFRRGEHDPYLVQQGGQSYGYTGGKLAHVYDRGGHPQAPDANARRRADQLDRQSRDQHDHARTTPQPRPTPAHNTGDHNTGPSHDDHQQPDRNGPQTPPRDDHNQTRGNGQHQQPGDHNTPPSTHATPTPTPTPDHRGDHNERPNDRSNPGH